MARYGCVQITAPTVDPVELEDAKAFCAIGPTIIDHDALLSRLIKSATATAEARTNRQICTATWDLFLDQPPIGLRPIYLPKSPLQSITSVKYYATDGTLTTWGSSNYIATSGREPAELRPAYNVVWPIAQFRQDAVAVRFVAGYGLTAAVPAIVQEVILRLVAHWFENRESAAIGTVQSIPFAIEDMLSQLTIGDEFIDFAHSYRGERGPFDTLPTV